MDQAADGAEREEEAFGFWAWASAAWGWLVNKSLLTVTVALKWGDWGQPNGIATLHCRKLCQKRWLYCDMVTLQLHGKETWKEFFIYRTWQEHAKSRAKPEDFTYKEIPVEFGISLDTL